MKTLSRRAAYVVDFIGQNLYAKVSYLVVEPVGGDATAAVVEAFPTLDILAANDVYTATGGMRDDLIWRAANKTIPFVIHGGLTDARRLDRTCPDLTSGLVRLDVTGTSFD